MQEKHVKEKQIEHQKEIIQMQEKLKSNLARQIKVSDNIMTLQDQYKKASQVGLNAGKICKDWNESGCCLWNSKYLTRA